MQPYGTVRTRRFIREKDEIRDVDTLDMKELCALFKIDFKLFIGIYYRNRWSTHDIALKDKQDIDPFDI